MERKGTGGEGGGRDGLQKHAGQTAGQGKARQGKAGQGKARQGKARQGKERQGKAGNVGRRRQQDKHNRAFDMCCNATMPLSTVIILKVMFQDPSCPAPLKSRTLYQKSTENQPRTAAVGAQLEDSGEHSARLAEI